MRTIEIIEGEHGWTVLGGGRFANSLTADEALWTVATLLMPKADPCRYLKTYEQEVAWNLRYASYRAEWREPAAFLEDLRVRGPAVTIARRMGVVRRTFDELGQLVNIFVVLKPTTTKGE